MKFARIERILITVLALSMMALSCTEKTDIPEDGKPSEEQIDPKPEKPEDPEKPVVPEIPTGEDHFISGAYVSSNLIGLSKKTPEEIPAFLDQWRWEGISDIYLISGIFVAGQDGTVVTTSNKDQWPPVYEWTNAGKKVNDQLERDRLLSPESVKVLVSYFKNKKMNIWLSERTAGWLQGGSFEAVVVEDAKIERYVDQLCALAKELGCVGLDFDWEFPQNPKHAEGYRKVMASCKKQGLKVSVCAISPTVPADFPNAGSINNHVGRFMKYEELIKNGMVDNINVMQYLAFNPATQKLDVKVKADYMRVWENAFPAEFTSKKKVNMLTGIGFYSYGIHGDRGKLNFTKLFEKYGEESYYNEVIGGKHCVWTPYDVQKLVRQAKDRKWRGVLTWLVTHDFTVEHPDMASRQHALAQEVYKIWDEEK